MGRVGAADLGKDPSEVAGMFDATAKRYDRMNGLFTLGNDRLWRLQMTRAVAPQPGERILDVAAGTGTSSVPMAKAGALVTALDFSQGMIDEGRRRYPELEFVHGDAQDLPFDADTFDAVTISFGFRNVQDPKAALAEFFRVLKPGGRLLVCEASKPPLGIARVGHAAFLRTVPVVGRLASSNPDSYRYLVESIEAWPDQETLSRWIRGAGFTRVAHRNLTMGAVALHRGRKPTEQTMRMATIERPAAEETGA
ncbi:class I SAM-dependent methyltransferase [Agrococcus versicolor]|uniref:class I SAM-dependent methyltransferase n=1 Tax=Agrococcus versicolor TaxID=501482 RepID=UPI003CD08244